MALFKRHLVWDMSGSVNVIADTPEEADRILNHMIDNDSIKYELRGLMAKGIANGPHSVEHDWELDEEVSDD